MTTLAAGLNSLPDHELPQGLHERIMLKVLFLRLQYHFFVLLGLLIISMGISGWHMWQRLVELDALPWIKVMIQTIQIDSSSWTDFAGDVFEFIPAVSIALFTVNALIVTYMIYLAVVLRKISLKGRIFF